MHKIYKLKNILSNMYFYFLNINILIIIKIKLYILKLNISDFLIFL